MVSLVDHSLVQKREVEGQEPRFYLLNVLREYGWERLTKNGELERCQDAHATSYLMLCEQAEAGLSGAQQKTWLERLEWKHEDLVVALRWLLEQHEIEHVMRTALHMYWFLSERLREGRGFLEQALAAASEDNELSNSTIQVKPLCVAGDLILRQYEPQQAIADLEAALALSRRLQDPPALAISLSRLGACMYMLGEIDNRKGFEQTALRSDISK